MPFCEPERTLSSRSVPPESVPPYPRRRIVCHDLTDVTTVVGAPQGVRSPSTDEDAMRERRESGGREDPVPRHGMTALGTAEPAEGAATGRRFGLSSWPIRRKLVALVIGPLLVILGAGALVTIQAIGQLREAQDSERIATASLYSNKLAQALQREVISTMTVIATPAKGTRLRLRNDRATTDAAFAQLKNVLADAPRG